MPGVFPAIGDILELRTYCYAPSQISVNTIHYRVVGATTGGASCSEIAVALDALLSPLYKPQMPTTARWRGVTIANIVPPRTIAFRAVGNDGAGTGSAFLAPTQVSGLIHINSLIAGPRGRGRIYVGFVDQNQITATGAPSGVYTTGLTTLGAAFGPNQTIVGGTGSTIMNQVILHRPFVVSGYTLVTGMTGSSKFATQKSRGMYGRQNPTPLT
jgi:hypothetical protein